jgi:hypothetical protein
VDRNGILAEVRAELNRINSAINALDGTGRRSGRPRGTSAGTTGRRKKDHLTPAGRRKLSQMMKARWAARRKKMKA